MTTLRSPAVLARLLGGTVLVLALGIGACGDESPTDPDPPERERISFDSLSIASAGVELGRGQSQDSTVTVLDGGAPASAPGLEVTRTSKAPATVSLMDLGNRTVRAEATGAPGDATVRASGEVTSSPARVRVLDLAVASSATRRSYPWRTFEATGRRPTRFT